MMSDVENWEKRMQEYKIVPIGKIISPYKKIGDAPKQGIVKQNVLMKAQIFEEFVGGISDLKKGEHYFLFFIFDKSKEYKLKQIPGGKQEGELKGVFSTRSPLRPNFIGMTEIEIVEVNNDEILFLGGDMLDGTPVVDLKPTLKNFFLQN